MPKKHQGAAKSMAGMIPITRTVGKPRGYRGAGSPASEIAMDPRNLDPAAVYSNTSTPQITNHPQVRHKLFSSFICDKLSHLLFIFHFLFDIIYLTQF